MTASGVQTNSKTANNRKFWNFTPRNAETNTPAELILYGDISSNSWYGDEVTPKLFNTELKALGDVDEIVVRINSGGGDVFAAKAIYTRLKDHKATITVKIDGWAASAATIIAMAGDKILIPADALFMIHNPKMGVLGYYSAEEFVELSSELDVIKQSIVKTYCDKTGKSADEISQMMDEETWLDGEQAVENGFCTELMFESVETETEDATHVIVNSVSLDLSKYKNPPKSLFNCRNSGSFTNKTDSKPQSKGGFSEMEIKTVEDLKSAYPELTAQIAKDATAAERKRIQDIETVSLAGYEKIANEAKFEDPISSGELAVKIIAEQKKQGMKFAANIEADVKDSGVNDVNSESRKSTDDSVNGENPYMAAIDRVLPKRKDG